MSLFGVLMSVLPLHLSILNNVVASNMLKESVDMDASIWFRCLKRTA